MKNTVIVIAVTVEMFFLEERLFEPEVHDAFWFNLISGLKNCNHQPSCLLPDFQICCEKQKAKGKNLKCDFPAVT